MVWHQATPGESTHDPGAGPGDGLTKFGQHRNKLKFSNHVCTQPLLSPSLRPVCVSRYFKEIDPLVLSELTVPCIILHYLGD